MKLLVPFSIAALLTACATNTVAPSLPQHATTYKDANNNVFVDTVNYTLASKATSQQAAKCIALNINNNNVTLSSSSSHIGSYTGTLYRSTKTENIAGGNVIQYQDGMTVIANGRQHYTDQQMIPVSYILAYKLQLDTESQTTAFSNIRVALKGSPDAGFNPLGAWPSAQPHLHIKQLDRTFQKLNNCLN